VEILMLVVNILQNIWSTPYYGYSILHTYIFALCISLAIICISAECKTSDVKESALSLYSECWKYFSTFWVLHHCAYDLGLKLVLWDIWTAQYPHLYTSSVPHLLSSGLVFLPSPLNLEYHRYIKCPCEHHQVNVTEQVFHKF
jgi:hypothetical protein